MADEDHTEEWRPVVGWEGIYSVSSEGRIRREAPGPSTRPGKALKPSNHNGYAQVGLRSMGRRATVAVHLLVARAFLGPAPDGHEVDHVDGNKANNRFSNLEYLPPLENTRRAFALGLVPIGAARSTAKLTEDVVRAIRVKLAAGESANRIARISGCSAKTVTQILHGRNWRHVS